MRLASISIANFRGFSTRRTIDLDADIVIVWGANGTGKTSLLDAMQWLVLGDVPRLRATVLRSKEDVVTSRYSQGPVSVEVAFRQADETTLVTRTGTGKDERLTVRTPDGTQHEDGEAKSLLAGLIGRVEDDGEAAKWFLRTHLLQQAEMTELLSGDTKERYRFLAQLTGLDELGRLDDQLQSELRQLRAAARERERESAEAGDRVAVMQREHDESRAILDSQEAERDSELGHAADVVSGLLRLEAPSRPDELLTAASRRVAELELLSQEIRDPVVSPETTADASSLDRVRSELAQLMEVEDRGQARLRALDEELLALQRSLRTIEDEGDKAAQLAQLALAALDEECPVCGQAHDLERTRMRLEHMLQGDDRITAVRDRIELAQTQREETLSELNHQRDSLLSARETLATAEQAARRAAEYPTVRSQLESRLRALVGLPDGGDLASAVEQQVGELTAAVRTLEVKTAASTRLQTLETEVASLTARTARAEAVCKWVGHEIVAATGRVIASSNPLAAELYRRLDVHPTFRRFSLKLDRFRESGHLRPWVHDDAAEKDAGAAQLLSAAQFNSLAVCLFLALNLEQPRALNSIVLDDPVQSMDDINVLSLVDVLRTVRRERQVVLTTHDVILAQLLLRKLRPLTEDQRLLFVKLDSWTRDGPAVNVEDYSGTSRPPFELVPQTD
jgi:DNA repair exonuclease SbcCD ATPase subunit